MTDETNIQPIQSDFEQIRKAAENGKEYWSARELATALGYSTWQKFNRVLNKALQVTQNRGTEMGEHFNQVVEMVKLGSGSFREVENWHLSRLACLIIAENADGKKPQVQTARIYFREQTSVLELIENQMTSRILMYKTNQGETRVEVLFNSQTFWLTQKRMADLYGVDVRTVSYHLGQIFATGELKEESVIRKNWITAADGKDYDTLIYNLDAIIAVGYRVNSYQATQFRIWATAVLKEFIIKGFVLDDERLNYLSDKEVTQLNRISNAFLDLAEDRADRHLITTMAEWKQQLERFMTMYDYELLEGAGTVSAEEAKEKAYDEYDKFRLIQDREYLSDFDKEVRNWKELGLFDDNN